MEERNCCLGLSIIKGLGSIRIAKLLKHFGSPLRVWQADERELAVVEGIGSLAAEIVKQRDKIKFEKVLQRIRSLNINFITINDQAYPVSLKNIYDPPPVLFYKGEYILDESCVAIVGSRKSTSYGRKIAEKMGYELAQKGITVVSGMARGIDTHGHLGSLKAKGKTIAVLGSGLDIIYPPENNELFNEIQHRGMVISEFPPGTKPLSGNFPQRNRIISGLSKGVLVVEASSRSGSLITASLALEQGRELFAIPGNINRTQSEGTNKLIKEGAKLVSSVNDILEELFIYSEIEEHNQTAYPELSADEEDVVKILQEEAELDINQLIEMTEKSPAVINTILLKLELKGIISREAGNKYIFLGLQNLLKPL
ncbi:DNA-protecting protein DprA [Iocasia frigidifontis]|uniref:DNA-protecting protein DprA n=1 Tax=Iocasia fonsfrigidae TaxID=2682810 RepID=A0A8A7KHU4_9FIRM|nr:DNA-processing protein DprA [Iocasia fonsfrigidae]QTL98437.1 DNA-protecting protein DprA [Iocasia fonsfrigidae]